MTYTDEELKLKVLELCRGDVGGAMSAFKWIKPRAESTREGDLGDDASTDIAGQQTPSTTPDSVSPPPSPELPEGETFAEMLEAQGFTLWIGGNTEEAHPGPPLDPGLMVEVIGRRDFRRDTGRIGGFVWGGNCPSPIIAYRVIEQAAVDNSSGEEIIQIGAASATFGPADLPGDDVAGTEGGTAETQSTLIGQVDDPAADPELQAFTDEVHAEDTLDLQPSDRIKERA